MDSQRRLTCIVLVTLVAFVSTQNLNDVQQIKGNNAFVFHDNVHEISPNVWSARPTKAIRTQHNLNNLGVIKNSVVSREEDSSLPPNERYPSAVLLGRTCGGTIIGPKWVITAAHCTLFISGRDILAGTRNSEDGSGVMIRIKKTYLHPLFTVGPYWLNAKTHNISQVAARYDFMLAELESPLNLDGVTIAAAKLDETKQLPAGKRAGYAGYGAEHHGETMRHEMHAMDLEVLSNEQCSTLVQYNSEDMLCARGVPPRFDSACNGDSGSGLISNGYLLGIASWVEDDALECGNGKKVVFSRIAAVRSWITDTAGI